MTPLDIVSAHPWQQVAFTTYALSLSFFEAVILDALVRGGSRAQALVLSDLQGVRQSLSERGAHRVGRDYEVEPVAVSGGVFHPKIAVFASEDECHLLVGSGNLTFNGWGGNCEVIEHLHTSFAAGAIADVAEFFECLMETERVRLGAKRECAEIATTLRRAVQIRSPRADIRFMHNLEVSLTEQIAAAADDLGGARRLLAAAPFWDDGRALDSLCLKLGLGEAFIHAHGGGYAKGTAACNWPRRAGTVVHAVRIKSFDGSPETRRRLHAKAFEIVCRRGRLIISGSANGSTAALGRDGNVEACVVRVDRQLDTGWKYARSAPPEIEHSPQEVENENDAQFGVLRAVLDGDQLIGQVLEPRMSGAVSVFHAGQLGLELLSDTVIGAEGAFAVSAPELEKGSWRGGRLILRVQDRAGRTAEGFVSLAGYAEVARQSGSVARRLVALIFGSETPEDVRAILDWFLEDPSRLLPSKGAAFYGDGESPGEDADQIVPVAALDGHYAAAFAIARSGDAGGRRWSRFIDLVLSAFRDVRGRFDLNDREADDIDEGTETDDAERASDEAEAIDDANASFDQLFEVLTRHGAPARQLEVAFDLTGFICARLNPTKSRAQAWLASVTRAWLAIGVRPERCDEIAAAILTTMGTEPNAEKARWARKSLLQLGHDLNGPAPACELVQNYLLVLRPQESFADLWVRIRESRTYQEQVKAYIWALEAGAPAPESYPDLPEATADAWPVLARALTSADARRKLLYVSGKADACPVDCMVLPQIELDRFRTVGIAVAKNCCGKVLIRKDP